MWRVHLCNQWQLEKDAVTAWKGIGQEGTAPPGLATYGSRVQPQGACDPRTPVYGNSYEEVTRAGTEDELWVNRRRTGWSAYLRLQQQDTNSRAVCVVGQR